MEFFFVCCLLAEGNIIAAAEFKIIGHFYIADAVTVNGAAVWFKRKKDLTVGIVSPKTVRSCVFLLPVFPGVQAFYFTGYPGFNLLYCIFINFVNFVVGRVNN